MPTSRIQIRPMYERAWVKTKIGPFVNRLSADLQQDYTQLQAHLATLPEKGREFLCTDFEPQDSDRLITARGFIFLLFRLLPRKVEGRQGEPAADRILEIVDEAEEHLLHHVASRSRVGYMLIMSRICAAHKTSAGTLPSSTSKALFTIQEFNTELDAAGVPTFYCDYPADTDTERICSVYAQLPAVVKDMFFAATFQGKLRTDIPLYILRDFILFAGTDDRWERLKAACAKDKSEGMEVLSEYLRDFLAFQRRYNNVSLGAPKKKREWDPAEINQRELAYLEICKPYKWLGKMWRENFMSKGDD